MLSQAWRKLWQGSSNLFAAPKRIEKFQSRQRGWHIRQVEALEVRLLLSGANGTAPEYDVGFWPSETESHEEHEHGKSIGLSGGGPIDPPESGGGQQTGSPGSGAGSPNIQIASAYLTNGFDQQIAAPAVGQMIYVHVNWTTTDLSATDSYIARFTVDGVNLDSGPVAGQAGNGSWYWVLGGWYADSGNHTVTVKVDGSNVVTETNESDNSLTFNFTAAQPTTLPAKLSSPIGGDEFEDWAIVNYIDVDPRAGQAKDYTGGTFQYDQHNGWDISLPNFQRMDSGVTVVAAADGVVASTQDGEFDRQTTLDGQDWNFVTINHGNGWQTVYGHLATDAIAVLPGQSVSRGDVLGFAGSSGNSSGAHLHFMVLHEGAVVETNFLKDDYWEDPWEYQGDRDVTVLDTGVSNYNPFAAPTLDFSERGTEKLTFSTATDIGDPLWFWYTLSHMRPSDSSLVRYIRPDGQVATSFPYSPTTIHRGVSYGFFANSVFQQMTGTWKLELSVNGQVLNTREVDVIATASPPELRVREGTGLVLDDRTTAIDIANTKTFTIQNYGGSTLSISAIELPAGFAISGSTPTTIAPDASATFTVQFNGTLAGLYLGDVIIRSNDNTNSAYNFRIRHNVVGNSPSGTPSINFSHYAIVDLPGGSATVIDPTATFFDSDAPSNAGTYSLTLNVVSGMFPGDNLQLASSALYSISGTNLRRGATTIATVSAAIESRMVIIFNSSATIADIQGVLRLAAFDAGGGTESSGQRIVSATVTDPSGKTSPSVYRTILVPEFENTAPVVPNQSFQLLESAQTGAVVGTLTASDIDEGQSLTYSITSSSAPNVFTINPATGVISVANGVGFNFESQIFYSLQVSVSDNGSPGLSTTGTVSILLQNVNEPPVNVQISASSMAENLPLGSTIGVLSTTDVDAGDSFAYTLVSGTGSTDNALFAVVGNQLRTAGLFNFEADSSYQLRIRTTDSGGLWFERSLVIAVTDANDPPTIALQNTTTTLPENTSTVTSVKVADIVVSDGDTLGNNVISLSGTDAAAFEVVGTTLRLKAGTVLDFDTKTNYAVNVDVDDPSIGASAESTISYTLTITNSAVTVLLQNRVASIPENTVLSAALKVADILVKDVGLGTNTLSLAGANAALFEIVGTELQLRAGTVLNFETRASLSVIVQVDNSNIGGSPDAVAGYTLNLVNLNEAPGLHLQGALATLPENTSSVIAVKIADIIIDDDVLGTNILSLSGPDAALFEIVAGALRIKSGTVLDYEAKSQYQVTIQVDDASLGGSPDASVNYLLTLLNINDPPTIALQNVVTTLPENTDTSSSIKVADILITDDILGSTVLSVAGADAARFEIVGNELRLKAGTVLNFENRASYSIRIDADDASIGTTADASVNYALALSDLNEAPTDLSLTSSSIAENAVANANVGTITVTDGDAGNTFSFGLVTGVGSTDNASFTLVGNTLKLTSSANFEAKSSYSVRLRATDQGGLSFEKSFTIAVTNVNEPATDILLTSTTISENNPVNTLVGTLSAIDPDAGSSSIFSLVGGAGSLDNESFSVVGNILVINSITNFETKANYFVRVRVTDQSGLTFDKPYTITITDVDEAPSAITLSGTSLTENNAANSLIGTLSATDPDAGSDLTFSLVAGAGGSDNSDFSVTGNALLINSSANYEATSSYAVRLRVTDQAGLAFEKAFTITVTDANEPPTNILLSATSVTENNAANAVVGTFSSTDPDASNTFTYSLASGAGSADNGSFSITGTTLTINASTDFETKSSYTVRVRVTDIGGMSFEKPFIISVTNTNEAPTGVSLSPASIAENNSPNAVVGTLTAVDPDLGNTFSFSLVAGEGSTDNSSFALAGNTLSIVASTNFEAKNSYSVRVRAVDQNGLAIEKSLAVAITNVNETPTDLVLSATSLAENNVSNSLVATLSAADPDANSTFIYSLVAGNGSTDNSSFLVSGNALVLSGSANFEGQNSYSIRLRVTDQGGLSFEKPVTITVTDSNDAPIDLSLSAPVLAENNLLDATVGTLTTIDPDSGNTFTYSLVSGVGSADNGSVAISGNTLTMLAHADFEMKSSYSIRVRATDQGGLSFEKPLTIAVTNVNEAPALLGLTAAQTIQEDTSTNTLEFLIADPETLPNGLVMTATSSNEDLIPSGNIVFGGTGAHRTLVASPATSQYGVAIITVTVSDGSFATSQDLRVTVRAVNDNPEIGLNPEPLEIVASSKSVTTIDAAATFTDIDTPTLKLGGAMLTVSGQSGKDFLTILNQNGISRLGQNVLFGSTTIGTVTGGKKNAPLTVKFNGNATQSAVENLLQSIGFKAAKRATGERNLKFQITNIAGLSTNVATRHIQIVG